MSENKFLIKSSIIEAIVTLADATTIDNNFVQSVLSTLKKIDDKNFVFKTIMNEFFKETDEKRSNIMIFLLSNVFEQEVLKDLLWQLLKSRNYNDETQNKILYLIKSLGEIVDYNEYIKYFDNPDKIIDKDTENMLTTATFNPESQIDFVDFISTLNDTDWRLMLESLGEDFNGDNLANIFIPLVYENLYNENQLLFLIDLLGNTSSSLIIEPLEDIVKYSDNEYCVKSAQKQLKMAQLKGLKSEYAQDFKKEALSHSKFNDGFITLVDGHGNFGLICTRLNHNNHYQFFSAVVKDNKEIVDCFGFSELPHNEYKRIINKFVNSQPLIKVDNDFICAFLSSAKLYSLNNKIKIPYEYFCWNTFLDTTNNPIKISDLTKSTIKDEYKNLELDYACFDLFDTWFYDEKDDFFLQALEQFDLQDNIKNDLEKFKDTLQELSLNAGMKDIIKSRLQIMAIILRQFGSKHIISIIAAINNDNAFEKLHTFILKHTIYEYFLREKEKINTKNTVTNIFQKKSQVKDFKFNINQVNDALEYIEANW